MRRNPQVEAQFEKAKKAALTSQEADAKAVAKKTARLKALRLAKEAAEKLRPT